MSSPGAPVSLVATDALYRTALFYQAYTDAPGIAASTDDQFVFTVLKDVPDVGSGAFDLEGDDRRFASTHQPWHLSG